MYIYGEVEDALVVLTEQKSNSVSDLTAFARIETGLIGMYSIFKILYTQSITLITVSNRIMVKSLL